MAMKPIVAAVTVIMLQACTRSITISEWKEFGATNLYTSSFTEKHHFIRADGMGNLYIGGYINKPDSTDNGSYSTKDYCILYKSMDYGRSWIKLPVDSMTGSIRAIAFKGRKIAVLRKPSPNGKVSVLISQNGGKSWCAINSFYDKYSDEQLYFNRNKSVIIIANSYGSKKIALKIYRDRIEKIPFAKDIKHLFFRKNRFVGIINNPDKSALIEYDANGKELSQKELFLKHPYFDAKQNRYGDIILYNMANPNNTFQIIRKGKSTLIDLSRRTDLLFFEPFVYKSLILVNCQFDPKQQFLGAPHIFLVSPDFGEKWREEKIPMPLITTPAILFQERFICGSGRGRLQERY